MPFRAGALGKNLKVLDSFLPCFLITWQDARVKAHSLGMRKPGLMGPTSPELKKRAGYTTAAPASGLPKESFGEIAKPRSPEYLIFGALEEPMYGIQG